MTSRLFRAVEQFTSVNPEVNATAILIFLFVAQRGTTTQKDIEVALGLNNATASRGVSWWCDVKRYGQRGAGFLEREEDPRDRRYRLVRLTEDGKAFYLRLRAIEGREEALP